MINCLQFKDASFIKIVACIMDDSEENERIVLRRSTIVFLLMDNKDILIEGIENSISPFNKYEALFVTVLLMILHGIENITIIPSMFSSVLNE